MNEELDVVGDNSGLNDVPEVGKQRILRRRDRIAARLERLSIDEQPLLKRLVDVGVNVRSIEDLIAKYPLIPDTAVKCLLDSLNTCSELTNQEWILRALMKAANKFDGREVVKCLIGTTSVDVRFVAMNVVALTQPDCIDDWLQKEKQDPAFCEELNGLAGGRQV